MAVTTERLRWRAYMVQQVDGFGYPREKFGVREEYEDGSTRNIHNETFDSREDAERLAAKFTLNAQKGMTYDNVMKTWR